MAIPNTISNYKQEKQSDHSTNVYTNVKGPFIQRLWHTDWLIQFIQKKGRPYSSPTLP